VINFKKSKQKEEIPIQDLMYEESTYVKTLLDELATNKLYLMKSEEYQLIQKILSDLNTFIGLSMESENIDQIVGFENAQELVCEILLQLHDGETEIFESDDNIYEH
jgi:hypothetical protein